MPQKRIPSVRLPTHGGGFVIVDAYELGGDEHCLVGRPEGAGVADIGIRWNLSGQARRTNDKWDLDLDDPGVSTLVEGARRDRTAHKALSR